MAAPSASNLKPWHFIVVTNRQILDNLARVHPYGKMLFKEGAFIIEDSNLQKKYKSVIAKTNRCKIGFSFRFGNNNGKRR